MGTLKYAKVLYITTPPTRVLIGMLRQSKHNEVMTKVGDVSQSVRLNGTVSQEWK